MKSFFSLLQKAGVCGTLKFPPGLNITRHFFYLTVASAFGLNVIAQTVWTNFYPQISDVAYDGKTYVIVGNGIRASTDLISWTPVFKPSSNIWTGVDFGAGRFVAVQDNGQGAWSLDGMSWVPIHFAEIDPVPGGEVRYQGIRFLNGQFFVFTGGFLASSDAINWKRYAQTTRVESFADMGYGNGFFVAVGLGGNIARSSDGVTWSVRPSPVKPLMTICFGDDWFIAKSLQGNIYRSADGDAWEEIGRFPSIYFGASIVHNNGLFITGGGNGTIYSSENGVDWVMKESPAHTGFLLFKNLQSRLFACDMTLLTSIDMERWEKLLPEPFTIGTLSGAISRSNITVVVGQDRTLLYRDQEASWQAATSPVNTSFSSAAFHEGRFYATGLNGDIISSPDGKSWALENSGLSLWLTRIASLNGNLLAVGYEGDLLKYEGQNGWEKTTINTNILLQALAYGKGLYLLAGDRLLHPGLINSDSVPTIFTSTDLREFRSGPLVQEPLFSAAFGNNRFVLGGHNGAILYSDDGLNWKRGNSHSAISIREIAFANGRFYALSYAGAILVSDDGAEWSRVIPGTHFRLSGLAVGPSSLVAVGEFGTIVEAPFDLYFGKRRKTARGDRQSLHGGSGRLIIQSSADLAAWDTFLEIANPPSPFEFYPGSTHPIFFRAFQQQEP